MLSRICIAGAGHAIGSKVVSNRDTSIALGLDAFSLEERTGIVTRRVCAEGESVTTLAKAAIVRSLEDAGIGVGALGPETVFLYIQNGLQYLTPPAGIIIVHQLECPRVRVLSLDGVCSEPVHAMEVAALLLEKKRCDRVIICAAVDFMGVVDPRDEDTAGLFGAGAGAIVLRRSGPHDTGELRSIAWETDATYWDLGLIALRGYQSVSEGINAQFSYYQMKGTELARVTVRSIRRLIEKVTFDAGWTIGGIDRFISHQPNPKMLEIGVRKIGIPLDRVAVPGRTLGNMGPASVLVALSMLKADGALPRGMNLLIVSFGLGFSCGCAALVM
ncbi:MAG: hypothetical protein K2Y27_20210 [Xanthobacteraceae bacterium]|nr:hypothetical protein [Xanthobacteraceae bacterium]